MPAETLATDVQRRELAERLRAQLMGISSGPLAPCTQGERVRVRGSSPPARPAQQPKIPPYPSPLSPEYREDTEQAGRERFILFAGPLVRAILDGRKTVTRRPVMPRPAREPSGPCPFGAAGDRLWVREKWGYRGQFFDRRAPAQPPFAYAADGPPEGFKYLPWKPSLHMPRAACRANLLITEAAAERLCAISAADATREGCPPSDLHDSVGWFRRTWDAFYAARGAGWADDPWVWVIRFEVVGAASA